MATYHVSMILEVPDEVEDAEVGSCAARARLGRGVAGRLHHRRVGIGLTMIAAVYARILIGTLCLLTLATSASAECAWVLWLRTTGEVNGVVVPSGEEWARLQANSTEPQCLSARDERIPGALAYLRGKYDGTGTTVRLEGAIIQIAWVNSNLLTKLRHECWPDTADPRGAKR